MPQQEERLSGALQENILCMLCFDDAHCKIIRGSISAKLFDSSVYREVAGHAIDFIDQYGEAIKEHLPDHLDDILRGDDERKAKTYERLLLNLHESKDTINAEYVISQLHRFIRMQNFKSGLKAAVEAVEDGRIEEAEVEMQKAMKSQAVAFSSGLSFNDPKALSDLFEHPEEEGFELGIPELDRRGIIPRRKELVALLAPRKRGKSWFLIHCFKQALLQRWKPLVITLEMSEKVYAGRVIQSFFSVSRREGSARVAKLVQGRDGKLERVIHEQIERLSLKDPVARTKIMERARREFKKRPEFRIKGFPMHALTLKELEAYLDGLERFENFVPDAILVDYPRLMKHDAKNLRTELGQTIAGIRGLCQARNAAGIIVHQTNRASETAALVTSDMAEEDISLVATVDVALTFSRTAAEEKLGLARLYADYVRNAEGKVLTLITQAYAIGQFCLDSTLIDGSYWDLIREERDREQRSERRRPREEAAED